jgi:hypothetical protein
MVLVECTVHWSVGCLPLEACSHKLQGTQPTTKMYGGRKARGGRGGAQTSTCLPALGTGICISCSQQPCGTSLCRACKPLCPLWVTLPLARCLPTGCSRVLVTGRPARHPGSLKASAPPAARAVGWAYATCVDAAATAATTGQTATAQTPGGGGQQMVGTVQPILHDSRVEPSARKWHDSCKAAAQRLTCCDQTLGPGLL